jgi:hypothetical protein
MLLVSDAMLSSITAIPRKKHSGVPLFAVLATASPYEQAVLAYGVGVA